MKKIFLLVALLALSLGANSCGNSASNSVVPAGENPGTASLVQLFPSQSVAQTNSSISLEAKVLDGNGMPVPFTQVTFTNLSLTGTFSPASAKTSSIKTAASTSAVTNGAGIATMRLSSTTSGFVTIEVEVSSGAGLLRDRKTVFFSPQSVSQLTPSLTLDVDDGDGTFDEPADFTMLKNANDNSRLIRATVMNGSFLVSGSQVTFGADRPFKVGTDPAAKCSDGSSVCDLIFPDGNVKTTNNVGQATTTIVVDPTILSNITSVLNITAQSDTGAFNIITLFLKPVTVSTVTVTANPQSVASAGISTITAQVTTSAGTPAPDGTAVNFSVTQGTGGVDAFAQTTSGVATAQFTAPTLPSGFGGETDRITATSGGVSGSTAVTVTAAPQPTATPVPTPTPPPLTVTPATVPISCTTGGIATFVVTGGSPGYTITSSLASVVVSPTTVTASGKTFSATVAADCTGIPAAGRPVSIAVVDTKSNLFTATVTITNP